MQRHRVLLLLVLSQPTPPPTNLQQLTTTAKLRHILGKVHLIQDRERLTLNRARRTTARLLALPVLLRRSTFKEISHRPLPRIHSNRCRRHTRNKRRLRTEDRARTDLQHLLISLSTYSVPVTPMYLMTYMYSTYNTNLVYECEECHCRVVGQ